MKRAPKSMIVAGVMSGTSADGVDVALARIAATPSGIPKITPLGHRSFRYPRNVRAALLNVMEGASLTAAAISQLDWRLGGIYADCIAETQRALGLHATLVGLHGQTIDHQAVATRSFGAMVRSTWQLGEAAMIREQLGIPVVSDFRPADLAAGGQGAPLVPMLDFCLFRSRKVHRILLNLGGIANITVIPAHAALAQVTAFDTGPANMVIDALMQQDFGKPFDRGGRTAAKGKVLSSVLQQALRDKYFSRPAPKSCGREQFGTTFAQRFSQECEQAGGTPQDCVATATELTVTTVTDAITRCLPMPGSGPVEVIAAGGGSQNHFLMEGLRARLTSAGVGLSTVESQDLDTQAKEAVAFALLAWLSWHGMPGNVPSATGAQGPRVLGNVTC